MGVAYRLDAGPDLNFTPEKVPLGFGLAFRSGRVVHHLGVDPEADIPVAIRSSEPTHADHCAFRKI